MGYVISFATDIFDVSTETPNDINPIAGQSVLDWLRERLPGTGFDASEPATEDWGWYIHVEGNGAVYLIGASGQPERPPPDMDWVVQIHRTRSLKDKLTGKNRLTANDPLVVLVDKLVRDEPAFRDVTSELEV